MESLYRKYRPQTFADVVGQQHVVGTLEHAVLEGRTSHAYLFCGPRGTGKTTMARLLAKALLCEQGAGHLPDGTCEQCTLIAAGEHPDVYELDAASRTGVDNVREEIINRVSFAPVQGAYKMYIIDEVHMLTQAAFNALLKTLEEPPEHVVFVLCTTDPQKIPATILSRVQRFDFRPIGNDDIHRHLAYVCEQEGFTYEDAALDLVVRHARGGMRDALSTLEQLSVFGSGVIGLEATRDLLGAVSGAALGSVVCSLADRDVAALFSQVGELVDSGRDLLQFTRELAAHLRDVYVVAAVGADPRVLPAGADAQTLAAEAQAFGSADRLARILSLLGEVSTHMATAPNQRLVLEIAFTRMARPKEDLTLEALAERVAELELRLDSGQGVAPVSRPVESFATVAAEQGGPIAEKPAVAPTSPVAAASESPVAAAPAAVSEQPASVSAQEGLGSASALVSASGHTQGAPISAAAPASVPTSGSSPNATLGRASAAMPAPASGPSPAVATAAAPVDPGALQRTWRQAFSTLLERMPPRGSLLSNALPVSDDGERLVVGLPKGSGFALKMLERADVRRDVEKVVFEFFGTRDLRFIEGLPSDMQQPRARRNAAPAGNAPRQETQQAPRPAAAPQTSQPVPAPEVASGRAGYPMPWDEPTPAPAPSYDHVPYDDFDAMPFNGYDEPAPPESAPPAQPMPAAFAQSPTPAGQPVPPASTAAPAPTPATAAQPAPPTPASAPALTPAAPSIPAAQPTTAPAQPPAPVAAPEATPTASAPTAGDTPQPVSPQPPTPEPASAAFAPTPEPAPAFAPTPEPAPAFAPAPAPAAQPAPATAQTPTPAAQPAAPTPAPTPAAQPAAPAAQPPAPEPTPASDPAAPEDLPPELSAILENAFEVFGDGVKVKQ